MSERTDTERLDWMQANPRCWHLAAPGACAGQTIREGIDAAMQAESEGAEDDLQRKSMDRHE